MGMVTHWWKGQTLLLKASETIEWADGGSFPPLFSFAKKRVLAFRRDRSIIAYSTEAWAKSSCRTLVLTALRGQIGNLLLIPYPTEKLSCSLLP
jgi:hypothetical protein